MNKKLFLFICLLVFSFCQLAHSQESASASITSVDTSKTDTNYVSFYKDKLILGLWQSERSFNILIDQKFSDTAKTAINYIANSNNVSGISVDYDLIGFAFGYKSVPSGNARTGNSDYLDLGLNLNTRGIRFENSFKRYSGFYDNNSSNYIHPFTDSTHYFQNPSMNLRVIKSKMIYAFNKKKFAMGASYANVKRQRRSKGSWLLIGNFYALNLFSDSSIIPLPLRENYSTAWDGLNRMNVYAYSAGFGGTYTVVFWKNFFFNFLASVGLETQYRHFYTTENTHYSSWKTQSASDWRASLGYNAKRFFMRISSIQDINKYDSKNLSFGMKFIAGSFDFGYRFNFKAPKPYQKFQETRLYKML